jgi:FkbM family methyltransferase
MPGELLHEQTKDERLDYPHTEIYLRVTSKPERHRLKACAKEPFTIRWIEEFIDLDDVLYDIGANVGVYSLVAAMKRGGGARVFAFEPSYANVAALCANVVRNGMDARITPLPMALSNETALRTFGLRSMVPGTARHGIGEVPAEEGPTVYRQPVLTYRLDDAVARCGLPLPDHIKLDVDGGELEVLEGAAATLASPTLKSLLAEVSVELTGDLVRALEGHGLWLDRRFDVQNRAGEVKVWYGLFRRESGEAAALGAPRVEAVAR